MADIWRYKFIKLMFGFTKGLASIKQHLIRELMLGYTKATDWYHPLFIWKTNVKVY
jgi:hypothetical protein